jgi:predicted ribosome quality control (RQC) complex YloA/Tae2 family protein
LQAERASKEPFHRFLLESGSVVLVGKNARTNDELTFKHARPSDYFFHTRGFEGAHTILKPNIPRGQRPSRQEIMTAASIAAYFSKARKQNNVPVSYTQRKFLKKNKKAKPGSVILMREEVVFVEPELPKRNSH